MKMTTPATSPPPEVTFFFARLRHHFTPLLCNAGGNFFEASLVEPTDNRMWLDNAFLKHFASNFHTEAARRLLFDAFEDNLLEALDPDLGRPRKLAEKTIIAFTKQQQSGQDQEDISFLEFNAKLISLAYAVLTDQRDRCVRLECKRIVDGTATTDFFSSPLKCAATYAEELISQLRDVSYTGLRSRKQSCPDCILRAAVAKTTS